MFSSQPKRHRCSNQTTNSRRPHVLFEILFSPILARHGFLQKDGRVNVQPRAVARQYLRSWFWVIVVSTIVVQGPSIVNSPIEWEYMGDSPPTTIRKQLHRTRSKRVYLEGFGGPWAWQLCRHLVHTLGCGYDRLSRLPLELIEVVAEHTGALRHLGPLHPGQLPLMHLSAQRGGRTIWWATAKHGYLSVTTMIFYISSLSF